MLKNRSFIETVIKLILPFALLVALLLLTLIFIFIPLAKVHALKNKQEYLKNLTQIACSSLSYYHNLEQSGKMSLEDAKTSALTQLRNIRFGENQKHYFWIVDMSGTTLMQPYTPEHEGRNMSNLTDTNGKYFIKEFIKTVKNQSEGVVEYNWKVSDNPEEIDTKISYVKLFAPWGWIIGTGVYMNEIQSKLSSYMYSLFLTMLTIVVVVTIIFIYILKGFVLSEKKKQTSFEKLLMQESKMKALLEAIPDMIVRIDREGVVLDVKDPIGFEPFINPSQILDEKIIDAWPAKIAKEVIGSIERVFVTGEHQILEFDVAHSPQKSLRIEAHFVLSGKDELLATFRDITERKI